MKLVKVTFADGNTIKTRVNGTNSEIRDYYAIGRYFNLGWIDDDMQAVTGLEFLKA